ncbi:hypothetical protein TanjilG_11344 [Lupinus angustifolius]|uniref:GIY-YIG domain-containing protein n=1 Tax=Lupinus angustifolius TaxID=3871 RepID=A0A1J7H8U2_LUPAN|nr:PREDICTED: protein EFFECTOR OF TRANSCRIPTION 2-like [Lupinus angustifolius]OIW09206.1 hypothetical protein TanjilG_11344 [Lupinus angustifolius]
MTEHRLKREQFNRTKHDSNFSPWKILIGPSDWEEYCEGKEGCRRYMIHNLPQNSGAGVYELGIGVWSSGLRRQNYKFAPDQNHSIVVVYIGQADNVRGRLQRYGRNGAHLVNGDGTPFFNHIFSLGYPILYRWAPMEKKEDAIRTEDQLLCTFDYAWNTSNNGTRRPDDILQKLNKIASGTRTFSDLAKVLLPFTERKVGIRIKSSKLPLTDDNKSDEDNGGYNFLSRVFKFSRSRPRIVQDTSEGIQKNDHKICGVALGDGSVCTRPPAETRKRCPEHKGMRTKTSNAKTIRAPKWESAVVLEPNEICQTKVNHYRDQHVGHDIQDPAQKVVENPADESISNTNICGIILDDGSTCSRQPVKGRKRCLEHKGMRINTSSAKTIPKSESTVVLGPNEFCQTKGNRYREHVGHDVQDPPQKVMEIPADESISNTHICGIILDDGSICSRQPVKGRKRCLEHKGKRNRASVHRNHQC